MPALRLRDPLLQPASPWRDGAGRVVENLSSVACEPPAGGPGAGEARGGAPSARGGRGAAAAGRVQDPDGHPRAQLDPEEDRPAEQPLPHQAGPPLARSRRLRVFGFPCRNSAARSCPAAAGSLSSNFYSVRLSVRLSVRVRRDGVDRSNGFEQQMFKMQNEKKTRERDMRQWVTSQYE